jgi:hypothetical protein
VSQQWGFYFLGLLTIPTCWVAAFIGAKIAIRYEKWRLRRDLNRGLRLGLISVNEAREFYRRMGIL